MRGARRAATAFALSFAVYLTPLVGPHAAWFLGGVLLRALEGRSGRDLAWVATDVAVALVAQLALGLLLGWFLARPGWLRGLAVALPVLPAIVLLNYAYLVVIPVRFLIEPDTAPERAAWPLECTARDVWIPPLKSPPVAGNDAPVTPLWVVEVKAPYRYGLFALPGCAVKPLALTQSAHGYATYVAAGRALYTTITPGTGKQEWSVFDTASAGRTPLEVEQGRFPVLSADGRTAAWLRPVAGSTPPIQLEAVIRSVDRPGGRVVDLGAVGRGGLELVRLDTEADELTLVRGLREFFTVGLDGRVRAALPNPEGVEPHPDTVKFFPDGWVAWDGYRENESYRVVWSLPGGKGSHRVPRSRGITSLAVSPDGRWIALSVTSGLSIGSTRDAVYVLGTADGREAFRRYFPKYTRSSLAFLGPGRFVYTDLEGVNVLAVQ